MPMIRRAQDPMAFDACLQALQPRMFYPLSFSPLGAAYYEAGVSEGFEDDSFVLEQAGALVLVCCNVRPGTTLARFGIPIEVIVGGTAGPTQRRKLLREAFGEIHRIARERGATSASFRTSDNNDPDGMVCATMLGARARPHLEFRVNVDLSIGEEALAADMRKGHRQQVRWGDKNLEIEVVGQDRLTTDLTDTLRQMHAEVAGRVTRPQASWDATHALVAADEGYYILARLGGELVGATIILEAADAAVYATGIYRREHFDKPLAHACVWRGMQESMRRGRRFFEIGIVPYEGENASEKEFAIGFFKHGFSSRIITSTLWTYPFEEAVSG
jgi:hypothetical protein